MVAGLWVGWLDRTAEPDCVPFTAASSDDAVPWPAGPCAEKPSEALRSEESPGGRAFLFGRGIRNRAALEPRGQSIFQAYLRTPLRGPSPSLCKDPASLG